MARAVGLRAIDITDDPWLVAHHVEASLHDLPAFINIRTCRHRWHAGTGTDGAPEWNRFELFKDQLRKMGLECGVRDIENDARRSVEQTWQEQLLKQ